MSTPLAADGGATGTVTAAAVTPGQTPTEGGDIAAQDTSADDFTAPVPAVAADTDAESAAREQHAADVQWRNEHPNEPLARAANPEVGGEAF